MSGGCRVNARETFTSCRVSLRGLGRCPPAWLVPGLGALPRGLCSWPGGCGEACRLGPCREPLAGQPRPGSPPGRPRRPPAGPQGQGGIPDVDDLPVQPVPRRMPGYRNGRLQGRLQRLELRERAARSGKGMRTSDRGEAGAQLCGMVLQRPFHLPCAGGADPLVDGQRLAQQPGALLVAAVAEAAQADAFEGAGLPCRRGDPARDLPGPARSRDVPRRARLRPALMSAMLMRASASPERSSRSR